MNPLHTWNVSVEEAIQIQEALRVRCPEPLRKAHQLAERMARDARA